MAEAGNDVAEAEGDGAFKLRIGARAWLSVGAPTVELSGVAEPFALHVVVAHFDHPFGSQRHERQIFPRVPARAIVAARCALACVMGSPIPGVIVEAGHQRLQLGE